MTSGVDAPQLQQRALPKAPTGITGLDEITGGGLPRGRPTLVCGGAGCGKTLLAMEFLVRGATEFGEPGVCMSFEETADELTQNVRSLGFDLAKLIARQQVALDYVRIERSEIEETGDYDLEGLFVRLGHAIDTIGARRVVLDTIESLFSGLENSGILRAELRRLFRWLKEKGVTAVITGERGDGTLTRHGLEEYVSDCVILLDHRVNEQVSTRRLRIVKYRGTTHGTNEYPFLIDDGGISVLPITSLGLQHQVSDERISTGIARLDAMLGGQGCYRGSTVLVTGGAGDGKSSLAASFVDAACRRGERCVYFAFEESPGQIVRNMRSIGLDLRQWTDAELLRIHSERSTASGLEMHLAAIHKLVRESQPRVVVLDPIDNLSRAGCRQDAREMLTRLIDHLKTLQITALLTAVYCGDSGQAATDIEVSSLVDTWLHLRNIESNGERNRMLYVLKSRGMAHSNQVREFLLTDQGVALVDACFSPEGVLTGAARQSHEAREQSAAIARRQELDARNREFQRKRDALEARIAAMRKEFEADEAELQQALTEYQERDESRRQEQMKMRVRPQAGDGEPAVDSARSRRNARAHQ